MDSRQPELSRLTLMCSDHEVAEFTWNHDRQAVTGKTHVLDAAHAPPYGDRPIGQHHARQALELVQEQGHPRFPPRCRGPPSRRRLPVGRLPHGLRFRRIAVRPILDPPRRISIYMARRQLLRERFQRRARRAASSARRLVGPLPHREDQGQRRPPRLITRCGPERQPAESSPRGRPRSRRMRAHRPQVFLPGRSSAPPSFRRLSANSVQHRAFPPPNRQPPQRGQAPLRWYRPTQSPCTKKGTDRNGRRPFLLVAIKLSVYLLT